jgi:hypothetical protein
MANSMRFWKVLAAVSDFLEDQDATTNSFNVRGVPALQPHQGGGHFGGSYGINIIELQVREVHLEAACLSIVRC